MKTRKELIVTKTGFSSSHAARDPARSTEVGRLRFKNTRFSDMGTIQKGNVTNRPGLTRPQMRGP